MADYLRLTSDQISEIEEAERGLEHLAALESAERREPLLLDEPHDAEAPPPVLDDERSPRARQQLSRSRVPGVRQEPGKAAPRDHLLDV